MGLYRQDAKACSARCRKRIQRTRTATRQVFPEVMRTADRWVRWTIRGGRKVPLRTNGRNASSTSPASWSSFEEASASKVGKGLGFVLHGDGIHCIDLDGVLDGDDLDPRAQKLLSKADPFYIERSPSGRGIHAWTMQPPPGRRNVYTQPDGLKVEWYGTARYMTMTGEPL